MVYDITLKISKVYEWKLIVNDHTINGLVIADIPEVLARENMAVSYNFFSKIVVCR